MDKGPRSVCELRAEIPGPEVPRGRGKRLLIGVEEYLDVAGDEVNPWLQAVHRGVLGCLEPRQCLAAYRQLDIPVGEKEEPETAEEGDFDGVVRVLQIGERRFEAAG